MDICSGHGRIYITENISATETGRVFIQMHPASLQPGLRAVPLLALAIAGRTEPAS